MICAYEFVWLDHIVYPNEPIVTEILVRQLSSILLEEAAI